MAFAQQLALRIVTARRLVIVPVAFAVGALAALGQAPVEAWYVSVLAFALIFGLLRQVRSTTRAALLGWSVGAGYFALALNWIVEPFFVDAARYGWMAPFAITFMAAGLALFWALAFAVARRAGGSALAFVSALTLAEALRGWIFTGFPWAQPGHIWIGTPVMPLAAYIGALGLCVITFAVAALIWRALSSWLSAGAALAAGVALLAIDIVIEPRPAGIPAEAPVVRLVQPNAAQREKWDPAMIPVFFRRQIEFTRAAPPVDLVVWSETAIPVLLNNAEPTLREISGAAGGAPVILGAQRMDGLRFYNSLALLGPQGQIESLYDKHHLVPFGEYFPYGSVFERFGLRGLAAQEGHGYSAGPGPQVIEVDGLGTALPLICYEGVFPRDVAGAPERPDFILLITNDAWFGKFSGPYQHFAQARLRSVEQGLPMIRVANTGISAMIDARGHVTASLPLGQVGYIDAPLPSALPPTLYARTGDLPILMVLLAVLGGALATARHRVTLSD